MVLLHEFYHFEALITLEHSLYANGHVMSMQFIFVND